MTPAEMLEVVKLYDTLPPIAGEWIGHGDAYARVNAKRLGILAARVERKPIGWTYEVHDRYGKCVDVAIAILSLETACSRADESLRNNDWTLMPCELPKERKVMRAGKWERYGSDEWYRVRHDNGGFLALSVRRYDDGWWLRVFGEKIGFCQLDKSGYSSLDEACAAADKAATEMGWTLEPCELPKEKPVKVAGAWKSHEYGNRWVRLEAGAVGRMAIEVARVSDRVSDGWRLTAFEPGDGLNAECRRGIVSLEEACKVADKLAKGLGWTLTECEIPKEQAKPQDFTVVIGGVPVPSTTGCASYFLDYVSPAYSVYASVFRDALSTPPKKPQPDSWY